MPEGVAVTKSQKMALAEVARLLVANSQQEALGRQPPSPPAREQPSRTLRAASLERASPSLLPDSGDIDPCSDMCYNVYIAK